MSDDYHYHAHLTTEHGHDVYKLEQPAITLVALTPTHPQTHKKHTQMHTERCVRLSQSIKRLLTYLLTYLLTRTYTLFLFSRVVIK